MIYTLYGTDSAQAHTKAQALIDSLLAKKPDAALVRVMSETFDESHIAEWTQGQGLFEQKFIVFLDRVFEKPDAKQAVLDSLKDIETSDNIFVMLEGALDAKTKKKIEKYAVKMQEFVLKEEKKEAFNNFALTDALGRRDKKQLWVLYQTAILNGSVAEELHGILFWQVKSMVLAETSRDANEAGVKPFVFSKAKGFAKNYSLEELKNLSKGLVEVYHEARRGKQDFSVALERWVLAV